MVTYENNCVDCPQGCVNCGNKHQKVIICDECDGWDVYADYSTNEGDFCEECLDKILNDMWKELTLEEKAEMLGIEIYEKLK